MKATKVHMNAQCLSMHVDVSIEWQFGVRKHIMTTKTIFKI